MNQDRRIYLGNYSPSRKRTINVYWDPADPNRPVMLQIIRNTDRMILITLRKSREDVGILEVESILRNAAENGKIPLDKLEVK